MSKLIKKLFNFLLLSVISDHGVEAHEFGTRLWVKPRKFFVRHLGPQRISGIALRCAQLSRVGQLKISYYMEYSEDHKCLIDVFSEGDFTKASIYRYRESCEGDSEEKELFIPWNQLLERP